MAYPAQVSSTALQFLKNPEQCEAGIHDDAKMRRVEAVKPPISYADLQRMPDDGNRYELYDGALWVVSAPLPYIRSLQRACTPRCSSTFADMAA